jgi:hypothetical protein
MPIFRYFVFVGGALLALLFAADFIWPASPAAPVVASTTAAGDQPVIRIRSDRHLPERVVLDTSQPTIAAPVVKTAAAAAPPPPAQEGLSPALADMSAKVRVRETFAQINPTSPKPDAAAIRKAETKVQAQPRRKVARIYPAAHPAPQPGGPMMLVAQQPHFGLFNTTW